MDPETPPGPVPQGPSHSGPSPSGGPSAAGPSPTGHPEDSLPEEEGTAGADPEESLPEGEATAGVAPAEAEPAGPAAPEPQAVGALDVLAATEQERDEYLDALRRLQADFENYKKRMQRQQSEILERAGEDLAVKLLPVLDTIDLATQHGEGQAIAPLASSLVDVLAKAGLERLDPVGQPFDPNEHEAVSHEPGDGGDGPEVSGLMRAGYRWKGRLVRAAMVTVRG